MGGSVFAVLVTLLVDKFVCLFNGYLVTPTNGGNQKKTNKPPPVKLVACTIWVLISTGLNLFKLISLGGPPKKCRQPIPILDIQIVV